MNFRFSVLAALLLGAALSHAQVALPSDSHVNFDISDLNGIPLHGEARGIPGLDYTSAIGVTIRENHSELHRIIVDRTHHLYFGYDLEALKVEGSPQIHLRFTPLTDLSSIHGIDLSLYTRGAITLPTDQTVAIGSNFEVPLELDQNGNTILHDHLNFGPPNP
jgi:hypothetical protein